MDSARPAPRRPLAADAPPDPGLSDPGPTPAASGTAPAGGTALAEVEAAPPGALARLGALLPSVDAVVRLAYRVAGLSALAVGLILWAVWDALAWRMVPGDLVALGVVLLLPAAAVALAGWTVADVARLPGQIRDAALAAAGRGEGAPSREGSRLVRLVKSLWAARGVALLTRGGWLKAVGALRFVRLASLPFAFGLAVLVLLNGVVIVGGVIALLVLVL